MLLPLCPQLARATRSLRPLSVGTRFLSCTASPRSSSAPRATSQAEPSPADIQRDALDSLAAEQTVLNLTSEDEELHATLHSNAPSSNTGERLRTHIHESRSNKGILLSSAVAVPLTRADKVLGPLRTMALEMVRGVQTKKQNASHKAEVSLTDDQVDEVVTSMVEAAAQAMKPRLRPADAVREAMGWESDPVAQEEKVDTASSRRPRRGMGSKLRAQFAKEAQLPFHRMLTGATRPIDRLLEKANKAQAGQVAEAEAQHDQPQAQ